MDRAETTERRQAMLPFANIAPSEDLRSFDRHKESIYACRMAGICGLVWHDLRATFGTRLGEAGFDAFTIAALMGHSNIRTTQRYVRATERNKREAVQAAMLSAPGHNLATKVNSIARTVASA